MNFSAFSSFRGAYVSDWRHRVVDAMLHAVCAYIIPGMWWFQYLPDMMLPIIWTWSMWTDRFLPEGNIFVRVHRALHSFGALVVCLGIMLLFNDIVRFPAWVLLLSLHWAGHKLVDMGTHGEEWEDA